MEIERRTEVIGELFVTSGTLLVADIMFTEFDDEVDDFLPERHPVTVTIITDEYGEQRIVQAYMGNEQKDGLQKKYLFTVSVDFGAACFVDKATFALLTEEVYTAFVDSTRQ